MTMSASQSSIHRCLGLGIRFSGDMSSGASVQLSIRIRYVKQCKAVCLPYTSKKLHFRNSINTRGLKLEQNALEHAASWLKMAIIMPRLNLIEFLVIQHALSSPDCAQFPIPIVNMY